MARLVVGLYITASVMTIISCASTGVDNLKKTNDAIVFEPEPTYARDTGFDVGFTSGSYDKESSAFPGFDSGFDGTRPGFSSGHSDSSVSQGVEGSHVINPDIDEIRPGFATTRPDSVFIGKGYDTPRRAIASRPSGQYPYFDSDFGMYPWFIERNARQTFNDGTRPGFSQGIPNIAFDGTRPGFSQGNQNQFGTGLDGTRPGFSQGNQNQFGTGLDGTRPGFSQGNQHQFDSGFDGTRPGFSQRYPRDSLQIKKQAFGIGFDGTRPGFVQNARPKFDDGFDGTRFGFSQKVGPNFDAGFDGTRPGFSQRGSRDDRLRVERSIDPAEENELVNVDSKQLGSSEKFLLQPHYNKYNGPFIPAWNQPMPYPTYFNNIGPYGPMGTPPGGFGQGGYWQ